VEELIALWYQEDAAGTPVLATPVAEVMTSITVPLGEPADEATVAGVTAAAREIFACFNAGDFARATALFSDELAQQFGPEPGDTVEDVRAFLEAPPEPAPAEEWGRVLAVTDVSVAADGRVAAIVVTEDPAVPTGVESALVFFVEEGGRWLADEVVEFTVAEEDE
jgi:hypothetical protein